MADSMSTDPGNPTVDALPPAGGSVTSRNRARIRSEMLDAAVELVIGGHEPTMRAVAERAGVGERTIYRYFDGREGLRDAVAAHLRPMLGVPLCGSVDDLEDYAARLFSQFETNHDLTVAFVGASWTKDELALSRSKNLTDLRALLGSAYPDAPTPEVDGAAATLRTVLSGSGWVYQRASCGLTTEEIIANASWLIRLVLERLEASEL
jgi:AcrR family transcriptional regulator